jgi:hypothetical protein
VSWAIGGPDNHGRWYGYGVPATCDQPECSESIDRGLAHACGDGVMGRDDNCGLHFCGKHLSYSHPTSDLAYCERCAEGKPPFDPKPETAEWLTHLLTDESWQRWRDENPQRVEQIRAAIAAATS